MLVKRWRCWNDVKKDWKTNERKKVREEETGNESEKLEEFCIGAAKRRLEALRMRKDSCLWFCSILK